MNNLVKQVKQGVGDEHYAVHLRHSHTQHRLVLPPGAWHPARNVPYLASCHTPIVLLLLLVACHAAHNKYPIHAVPLGLGFLDLHSLFIGRSGGQGHNTHCRESHD